MICYHASRNPNLCTAGIRTGQTTLCSIFRKSTHIYVGTLNYIHEQYLKYCPMGTYYIYEIDIEHELEPLPAKGQWRTTDTLYPSKIAYTHCH
jgi:hypothetical protein